MPGFSWLLNLLYGLLLIAVSPVLLFRFLQAGKYREGWSQKFLGQIPERNSDRPCVWLHAVSVGEVLQLRTILDQLTERRSGYDFVISTTTSTGFAVAREKFPAHQICYFPLDFSWSVRRALRRIRPSAVVLVELELWPNFLLAARRQNVPVVLINGRMSRRSFRGYRWIRPLMKHWLSGLRLVAVQNATYADRLKRLGADPERLRITGSLKFDHVETDRQNPRTVELRESLGIEEGETVWIAGSTQAPEEELALDVYREISADFPQLRLILVPRHRERFEEVARLVQQRGWPLLRRSQSPTDRINTVHRKVGSNRHNGRVTKTETSSIPPVLLLDTLGELAACWGLADIAFVGGSLTSRGGQNMIEPAGYGAAVLFGPNTQNFRDVVELLLSHEAACVVRNRDELSLAVRRFLENPRSAETQGRAAQQLVLAHQGATEQTVRWLLDVLPLQDGPAADDNSTGIPVAA